MAHCKTVVPTFILVTVVVAEFGALIKPDPLKMDHVPTPILGVLPFIVASVPQICKSVPAFAAGPCASLWICTVSVLMGQMPLEMVQTKVLLPVERPFANEVGLLAVITTPPPASTDHVPVPTVAVLPTKWSESAQIV